MENQSKNSGLYVLIVILCILVLGLGGYIVYDKIINNNTNNISNDNSKEIKKNNNREDNTPIIKGEINDNTNNASLYEKEYSTKTNYEVSKDFCLPTTAAFIFEIKDGVLTLTNKSTGESSTFKNVTNFKNLEYVQLYTSCTSYAIYLLTDDGKIYESTISLSDIKDVNSINNMFRLIELPIKVNEIGVIKTPDGPATAEMVLLKDENNIEYYGAGSDYSKVS